MSASRGDQPASWLGSDDPLLRNVVRNLSTGAPSAWTRLMADFEPGVRPARAYVTVGVAPPRGFAVPPEAVSLVVEHQRRSAAAGSPWHRLVLDCDGHGQFIVRTDPAALSPAIGQPGVSSAAAVQTGWTRRVLSVLSVVCVAAAVALFVVSWRWSPLPAADADLLPAMTQREQSAFAVLSRFFDAKNRGDAAGMREVSCADPQGALVNDIGSVEQNNLQEITFVDAIVDFADDGSRATANVLLRFRGISERMQQVVAERQLGDNGGGLFFADFTFVDDGSGWKVCGR